MGVLWKLTSQGVMGPAAWHGLALAAHLANTLLLWLILVRRLSVARLEAWMATLLFAVNAPGFEALAWACGLGYVLVTFCILLSVYLALSRAEESSRWTPWTPSGQETVSTYERAPSMVRECNRTRRVGASEAGSNARTTTNVSI